MKRNEIHAAGWIIALGMMGGLGTSLVWADETDPLRPPPGTLGKAKGAADGALREPGAIPGAVENSAEPKLVLIKTAKEGNVAFFSDGSKWRAGNKLPNGMQIEKITKNAVFLSGGKILRWGDAGPGMAEINQAAKKENAK